MRTSTIRQPLGNRLLVAALWFQGTSGVGGGIGLVADPTGATLGIPQEWLAGSPFATYLIPGVVLLLLLGVFPLAAGYGVLRATRWAWPAALAVGGGLAIWIGVEIAVVGYQTDPPLQLIYGTLALVILALSVLPPVRRHLLGKAAA